MGLMAIATGGVYAKQNIETVSNQSSLLSHQPSVEQFSDVLALLINNTSSQNLSRLQKLSLACRYSQLTLDETYRFEQGLFAAAIAKIILQVNFLSLIHI